MRVVLALLLVGVLWSSPCLAWKLGGGGFPQIILSVGSSDTPGIFINFIKSAGIGLSTNSPTVLDANGYPNASAPTATISVIIGAQPNLTVYSGTWEEGWTGTGAHKFNQNLTMVTDPQSCTGVGTGGTFNTISGTNCDVVFNYQSNPNGSGNFPTTGTYSSMNNMYLIRSSDKTAYLAGQIYTPEWLSILAALKPLALRTMGMTFPGNKNSTGWAYRTQLGMATWNSYQWIPNLWSATITGTDQYTASAATDTPGSWTDGETLQGHFTNASAATITISGAASSGGLVELTVSSTSTLTTNQNVLVTNYSTTLPMKVYAVTVVDGTHVTLQGSTYSAAWGNAGYLITTSINVGSRGAKFIVSGVYTTGSQYLVAPTIAAGAYGTLVYDAILGVEVYWSNGIASGIPFEALAAMANESATPLWTNIPPFYGTSDVTSLVDYLSANLTQDLFLEYNNENWNFVFEAQLFYQRGLALGIPASSSNAVYSATGLRFRQLMGAATSAWTSSHTLHRILAAAAAAGPPSGFGTYQFAGASLCGTSCGNSTYQSVIGVDYNASPNRPQDYADGKSVATYFQGCQVNQNGGAGTLAQLQGIIAAGTNYAAGGSGIATALAFMDSDTNSGTWTGGAPCGGNITLAGLITNVYTPWSSIVPSLPFYAYEGGYAGTAPTAAWLNSIGDTGTGSCTGCNGSATDALQIQNLIQAYRASSLLYATTIAWNTQLFVNFGSTTVKGNSWLQVQGSGGTYNNNYVWSLLQGGIFPAVPYQPYNAIGAINFLLNRDIDPASNDNTPAFMTLAA